MDKDKQRARYKKWSSSGSSRIFDITQEDNGMKRIIRIIKRTKFEFNREVTSFYCLGHWYDRVTWGQWETPWLIRGAE